MQQSQIAANTQMGGSGYELGLVEPNFQSLFRQSGAALNVTLFRPYPWEARKLINIPAMIESLLTLFLTLWVLLRVGPIRLLSLVFTKPVLQFCLLFTVSVGIIVGLFAFNFGTLVRYKIPILPFYYTALILLWHYSASGRNLDPMTS